MSKAKKVTREDFIKKVLEVEEVAAIVKEKALTKDNVKTIIEASEQEIVKVTLEGNTYINSVGIKFSRKERQARTGRNPQTGEEIKIPAQYVMKVTPMSNVKKQFKELKVK